MAGNTTVTIEEATRSTPRRHWLFKLVREWPLVPLAILALLVACAIFAPLLASDDPLYGDLRETTLSPVWYPGGSARHVIGTDTLGRDLLSRVIYGARISLMVATIVLSLGAIGGTLVGLAAGYYGGQVDELLMRFVDFTLAIPFILIALVIVVVFGQSLTIIVVLLAIFSWSPFARQVRAETLHIKTLDYVSLAKVAGMSAVGIMYRHMLPGVVNTVIVIATLRVGSLILTEAILSYLGVGVPPPTPAWGAMVSDGRDYLSTAWWIAFFPGMAIFLTVLAFNFLGDWLRDKFDPRLRQL